MREKSRFIPLAVLAVVLSASFFMQPATGGQESIRSECEKRCMQDYQTCLAAPNPEQAACKSTFDTCKEKCAGPQASPSPTSSASPSPSPSPTETATPSPGEYPSPTPGL